MNQVVKQVQHGRLNGNTFCFKTKTQWLQIRKCVMSSTKLLSQHFFIYQFLPLGKRCPTCRCIIYTLVTSLEEYLCMSLVI